MNRKFAKLSLILSSLTALTLAAGCGGPGTTNNDQGIAVSLLGFFQKFPTSCTQLPDGLAGGFLQLGTGTKEPVSSISGTDLAGVGSSSAFVGIVGIQNNLYKQYFRGDRLLLSYNIPGASIQPPNTTVPISLFAGPGEGSGVDNSGGIRIPAGSSLPPTFQKSCNRVFSQTFLIPASIREWMNFNRASLPEPPFQMEVTASISGIASSGDRFETNSETLPFDVVPEIIVAPTDGTGTATGTTGSSTDTSGLGSDTTSGTDGTTETIDTTTGDTSGLDALGNAITTGSGTSTGTSTGSSSSL